MYKRVICRYDMDIHRNLCAKNKSFYCSFLVISAMGTSRGGKNPFFKRKIGATETGHAEKIHGLFDAGRALRPQAGAIVRPFKGGPGTSRQPGRRWRRRRRRWSAAGCACCGSRPPRRSPEFSSGTARPSRTSRSRSDPPDPGRARSPGSDRWPRTGRRRGWSALPRRCGPRSVRR